MHADSACMHALYNTVQAMALLLYSLFIVNWDTLHSEWELSQLKAIVY